LQLTNSYLAAWVKKYEFLEKIACHVQRKRKGGVGGLYNWLFLL